jgi:hypothetical protein
VLLVFAAELELLKEPPSLIGQMVRDLGRDIIEDNAPFYAVLLTRGIADRGRAVAMGVGAPRYRVALLLAELF